MKNSTSRSIYISAAHKSSGKTIVSLGLSRILSNLNQDIQTFKKGPDYIDMGWLSLASKKTRCSGSSPSVCLQYSDYAAYLFQVWPFSANRPMPVCIPEPVEISAGSGRFEERGSRRSDSHPYIWGISSQIPSPPTCHCYRRAFSRHRDILCDAANRSQAAWSLVSGGGFQIFEERGKDHRRIDPETHGVAT